MTCDFRYYVAAFVRDRRLPSNPARGVNLPRKVGKQRHDLTHAQVQILADESRHNATLVLLLAYTGLRWGEAVGLHVNSLDLAQRRVLVQTNAVRVGRHIVIGSPKGYAASKPLARRRLGKLKCQN
ncbi:tyrosine-type recombinase/integrase [Cryobacterium aureum]|uniref:tyrosine-type recombinase/integrase n=1 Tax=Cryobacterium aureum TaxID=995037 RepID=UPI0013751E43|nr:tyrosine-type recombinase/integrase [Cryobacterium aureum]